MTVQPPQVPEKGVLIATRGDLFPANFGSAVKIHQTALALSKLGCPVRIVTDDRRHYYAYSEGQRTSVSFPPWLRFGPWSRLLRHRLRLKGVPVDEGFVYVPLLDWSITLRVAYVAAISGARVFQAESPGYALPCSRIRRVLGGCVLLAEHNVEFERISAQHPGLSPRVRDFLKKAEIDLCNRADRTVTVSELDREALVAAGVEPRRTCVIPLGVDVGSFSVESPATPTLTEYPIPAGSPLLVYHGTFRYPPNLQAVRILAEEILPRLEARGLRPTVLAVGAHPPASPPHPNIVFTGAVQQVAPYLRAAKVAVVPLQQGGGTRMKVLDYFAASVPVVSTSKGVEGLGLADGEQVLIRDDYDGFARAVSDLLTDPETARRISESARRHVQQFDWPNIARAYLDLYSDCLRIGHASHGARS